MEKCKYTREDLLKILEGYAAQIKRSGKTYPTAVISDLECSIAFVLEQAKNY